MGQVSNIEICNPTYAGATTIVSILNNAGFFDVHGWNNPGVGPNATWNTNQSITLY